MAPSAPSAPSGLQPSETAFLASHEAITVLPRSALPPLPLLSGTTPALAPPHRAALPLWLALLLKQQGRADIQPPPWLRPAALEAALAAEAAGEGFAPPPEPPPPSRDRDDDAVPRAPPFEATSTLATANAALPYHWHEIAHALLEGASDNVPDAAAVRRLVRDLREVRAAKLRRGVANLEGGAAVALRGVGGWEVGAHRGFVAGVVDGLRQIGASAEAARREREEEGGDEGDDDDDDDAMVG